MKKHGSNQIFNLAYEVQASRSGYSTLAPGLTVGYRVFNSVIVGLGANYMNYRSRLAFERTLENPYTEVTEPQTINYEQPISELSFGLDNKGGIIRLEGNM